MHSPAILLGALCLLAACGGSTGARPAGTSGTGASTTAPVATAERPATATTDHATMDHAAMDHAAHGATLPPVTIPAGAIFTEADVRFMQGMIAHHAQAIAMTRLAVGAGANAQVLKLARKIDLSQAGEIVLMQEWLRANGQFAPDTSSWHTTTMHGMLTPAEMARLEAARGAEYDRLFLTYMIRHHQGALQMVHDLFATPRAGQDVDVSVFANDVESTQSAEIALMRALLLQL